MDYGFYLPSLTLDVFTASMDKWKTISMHIWACEYCLERKMWTHPLNLLVSKMWTRLERNSLRLAEYETLRRDDDRCITVTWCACTHTHTLEYTHNLPSHIKLMHQWENNPNCFSAIWSGGGLRLFPACLMERCEPSVCCETANYTMQAEPFSVFLWQEESRAYADHGADAVQVRRSVPTEATCTENALRVRCSC